MTKGININRGANLAIMDSSVLVLLLITIWIFLAPLGNGRPVFNSSLITSIPLVMFLLPLRYAAGLPIGSLSGTTTAVLLSFFFWAVAALFSAFASEQGFQIAGLNFLGGYLIPFLVFVSFLNLPISMKSENLIWGGLALGVTVVMGRATLAYYSSWGIPSAVELLMSRYDLVRMAAYMDVTYGNTGSTAEFLVLVTPGMLMMFMSNAASRGAKLLFGVSSVLCIANLLIVQSRAAFVVVLFFFIYTLFAARVRLHNIILSLAAMATAVLLPLASDLGALVSRFGDAIFIRAATDNAISERVESIQIGWRIFMDHFFYGVGPNLSQLYNRHFNAHQIWVDQASELGVLGLLPLIVLTLMVCGLFVMYSFRGPASDDNWRRYRFIVGPAAFLFYGMISNVSWSYTTVNVWAVVFAALLGCSTATFSNQEDRNTKCC